MWASLQLLNAHLRVLEQQPVARLSALVCPNGAGDCAAIAELAAPSFLGITCKLCMDDDDTAEVGLATVMQWLLLSHARCLTSRRTLFPA